MKKILVLIVGLILVLIIGFYFYSDTLNTPAPKLLSELVPADAVIIYENKNSGSSEKNNPFIAFLKNALKQDSVFISALSSKEMTISLHITGKEDFGIIYYQPDSAILKSKIVTARTKQRNRNFEGHKITELTSPSDETLSYTIIDNAFVASRESLLIEDVIRSAQTKKSAFALSNSPFYQQPQTESSRGNLYINMTHLAKFCNLFIPHEMNSAFLTNLGNSLVSDTKMENQTLSMNGFALDIGTHPLSSLSLFNDQKPAPSEIRNIISNRSLFLLQYGISDFNSWGKRRLTYCRINNPNILHLLPATGHTSDSLGFYNTLGHEVGTCRLEGSGHTEDILILEMKDVSSGTSNTLIAQDLVFSEKYSNYQINKIAKPDLIYTLLWPLTENRNLNFCCQLDRYLLFSESTDALKSFLKDADDDNTWGKSSEWNTFFSSTSPDDNISFVFNAVTLLPWLLHDLSPKWKEIIRSGKWNNLQKGSFQFTRLDKNYYFNGVMQFDWKDPGEISANSTRARYSFTTAITFISSVKNHSTGTAELFIQTDDKTVHLLSADFNVLFNLNLKDKIKGTLRQIDYYKNKKLQYLFLAGRALYLVDRLGNFVRGFPKMLNTPGDPRFLTEVDYDNTLNYRFLIADDKGNLFMLDKEGMPLPGWDGKTIGTPLFTAPRHVRASGKDFIVCVDVRGSVYAFTRKGELIKGFPVVLDIKPQGDWYFETSGVSGEGLITLVSGDGTKVQVNLNGKTVTKENFVRSSADSKFSLVMSSAMDNYVISRVDGRRIAILGPKGETLLEKENAGSDDLVASFWEFGAGEKLFCFRDLQQDFFYVFSDLDSSLFRRPLETTVMPSVWKNPNNGLTFFTGYKNQLRKVTP